MTACSTGTQCSGGLLGVLKGRRFCCRSGTLPNGRQKRLKALETVAFQWFKAKPCLGKWLYDFRDVIKTTTHLDNLFKAVVVVIVTQS